MRIEKVSVLGVDVARFSLPQVLEWIRLMIDQGKPRHIVTANAEIIYLAHREPGFAEKIKKADLITADGSGVVWAAKVLGEPVPERITGIDLINQLFTLAEEKGWGVYFLGAKAEVVEKAVLNTLSKHTSLIVSGFHHGFFSQEEKAQVMSNICKEKPSILLVALGFPRQEEFIQEHLKELNVPISIGVGGAFDILAGTVRRAPLWMQQKGLEWLYRLYLEPKRFNRMLALPKFALAVLKQKRKKCNLF